MDREADSYWSLYLDFVDAMGDLRVRGIPLALVGPFHKYVGESSGQRLSSGGGQAEPAGRPVSGCREERRTGGASPGLPLRRIQPAFESRINRLMLPAPVRSKGTRVALCTSLLRFPESVYYEYFRPEKAVILADYAVRGRNGTRHGLPVHNLREYGGDGSRRAQASVMQAEKRFRRLSGHPSLADGAIKERFLADIPEMVRLIDQADRYMKDQPPACLVIGTTELMITRVLALAARRRGVPAICLQHGVIALEQSYMPVFADLQAVYGPADLAWYAERGVSRRRLAVTGHPRYDPIFTSPRAPAAAVAARLGLPPGERCVLVATQPHLPEERIDGLIRLLARNRRVRVLLKPHPLELLTGKTAAHSRWAKAYPNVTLVPPRVGLDELLSLANCVIAESSTVGLEALMAGRPLFVLQGPYSGLFERWGVPAGGPEQVAEWTEALLEGRARGKAKGGMPDAVLKNMYPRRLSAPVLAGLIRRTSGIDCRPRISWLRDGLLLKSEGPAIYLIRQGMRRRIAGPKQLKALIKKHGEAVRVIKPELMKRIPRGEPLR